MSDTRLINVKQIYYQDKQKKFLDPAFEPYNNLRNPDPEWHEYHVFLSNYPRIDFTSASYHGFVSWKFSQKTGITGQEFISFIDDNPGYDVYFINPFHEYTFLFKNVWFQGDFYHPGTIDLIEKIFSDVGYSQNLRNENHGEELTSYCNYWVGNKRFWDEYIAYTKPIHDYIRNSKDAAFQIQIHSRADKDINASYIAFIMERLFSSFLSLNRVRYISYRYSEEFLKYRYGELYKHLHTLRLVKELESLNSLDSLSSELCDQYRSLVIEFKRMRFEFESYKNPAFDLVLELKKKIQWRLP